MQYIDIIKANAAITQRSGVTVNINRRLDWVDLKAGESGEIFLQGDDAVSFINRCDELSTQFEELDFGTIEQYVAYDYLTILGEM